MAIIKNSSIDILKKGKLSLFLFIYQESSIHIMKRSYIFLFFLCALFVVITVVIILMIKHGGIKKSINELKQPSNQAKSSTPSPPSK